MGNKTQKVENNKEVYVSKIKHPKLFNSKFVQINDEMPFLQLTQAIPNREIYDKWKKGVHKYAVHGDQLETILIPKSLEFEEKGICGSSGVVKSRYPVLPYVLSEEIINRALLKQKFLQTQLWYLLYILCVAGATAHKRNIILGDIRPQNILMSEDGQIFVCCLQSFLEEEKNYYKTLSLKLKTYLAPEQIQDMQQGKDSCTKNQAISQCFSIGLTILAALLLRDETQLYGIDYTFNESLFHKQLNDMRNQGYNSILKQIVEAMLRTNQETRLTCQQVIEILKPYEESVANLEKFEIDEGRIPNEIREKLATSLGRISLKRQSSNQYLKVINDKDFNRNSRVKYVQSPRMPPNNVNVMYKQSQIYAPPPQIVIAQSQAYQNGVQSHVINSPSMIYTNEGPRNVPVIVTQSLYAPGQQQKANITYPVKIIEGQRGLIPTRIVESSMNRSINTNSITSISPSNPQIIIPTSSISSHSQQPSFIQYTSGISSFIPNQYTQTAFFHAPSSQPMNPEISKASNPRPHTYQSSINSQYQQAEQFKNSANVRSSINGRDEVFESYEKAMKNIDEKLRESRKEFPDGI